uniref:Polyprenyl synthetase n=1 Tax=Lutzomyia longipalpis TaxID=7200 RepID=A0A1B0CJV3_LUTLO
MPYVQNKLFLGIVNEVTVKTAMMDNLGKGDHIARVMEYFMPRNVLYNGIATAETYKILAPKAKQTPKDIKLAYYLGWCFEMLGDSYTIVDDIVDRSETRRNQPCWHNVDGIGLSAINDALLLETSALYILKKHFGKLDCFLQLLDIFHDLSFSCHLGQQVEVRSAQNVNNFTVENFESIAMNFITNFSGYIPVALAMTLAGYPNLEPLQESTCHPQGSRTLLCNTK